MNNPDHPYLRPGEKWVGLRPQKPVEVTITIHKIGKNPEEVNAASNNGASELRASTVSTTASSSTASTVIWIEI